MQYEGKKESLRMLVDRLKIEVEFATIYHRIKRGWDPYKAIHTPARKLTKRIK